MLDLSGRHVRTILGRRLLPAGERRARFGREHLPAGIYFLRLQVGAQRSTRKLVVLS